MIALVILGIAILLSCFWLWDSWRRANADHFTIRPLTPEERGWTVKEHKGGRYTMRPLTPEERKEAEETVNETDDFMLLL